MYYKGDDHYKSIAAASIMAKTARDNYILQLVKDVILIWKNMEYIRIKVMEQKNIWKLIEKYGITKWHRKSFAPCKDKKVSSL